ncbi:MAG: ribonuclease M5 [Erysipelotrichaceae bacterium]
MINIKEWLVVEGKSDTANLKKYYNVQTIETNGYYLSKEIIDEIKKRNQEVGVIIFTDPDSSGNSIRKRINEAIPKCLNAYLPANACRSKDKVGIEHADFANLDRALKTLISFKDSAGSLIMSDLIELNLCANKYASELRKQISRHYNLGDNNAKALLKKLNALNISYNELKEVIYG